MHDRIVQMNMARMNQKYAKLIICRTQKLLHSLQINLRWFKCILTNQRVRAAYSMLFNCTVVHIERTTSPECGNFQMKISRQHL